MHQRAAATAIIFIARGFTSTRVGRFCRDPARFVLILPYVMNIGLPCFPRDAAPDDDGPAPIGLNDGLSTADPSVWGEDLL